MNKTTQYDVAVSLLNELGIAFETPADHCFYDDVINVPNIGMYKTQNLINLMEELANKKDIGYKKVNAVIGKYWNEWMEAFDNVPIQEFTQDGQEAVYYTIEKNNMASRIMSLWGKLSPGIAKNSIIQITRYSYSWRIELTCDEETRRDYFACDELLTSAISFYKTADLFNWALKSEMLDKHYTLRAFLEWYDELGAIIFSAFGAAPTFHITEPESLSIDPYENK